MLRYFKRRSKARQRTSRTCAVSLPLETHLDIVAYVDYGSLVSLKFVHSTFLAIISANADKLALLQSYSITDDGAAVELKTSNNGVTRRAAFVYDHRSTNYANAEFVKSQADAVRLASLVIGPHAVRCARFRGRWWEKRFLKSIRALKYASSLTLSLKYVEHPTTPVSQWAGRSTKNQRDFVASFLRLQKLELTDVPSAFDFTVLTDELLLRIPRLRVAAVAQPPLLGTPLLYKDREAEVIRYCLDFARLEQDEPKHICVDGWQFSHASAKDLIESIVSLDRWVTVMLTGRIQLENLDSTFHRVETATAVRFESGNRKVFVENYGSSFIISNDADWT
ncbi:hypothetical protein AAVH_13143 [Aphelenchoides avenae]|nr:hypothetical protein AAVH_13143 [Aphelenchus avenae]